MSKIPRSESVSRTGLVKDGEGEDHVHAQLQQFNIKQHPEEVKVVDR